jgi:FkbM family methyltransferase
MNFIKRASIVLRFFQKHPLARKNKFNTLYRFLRWQIAYRVNPSPRVVSFIENSKLYIEPHMAGATGNIYVGLHDFEDMSFLLHFLNEDDLFCDIGANVGVYTVLASSVRGARTVSIEPSPITFSKLAKNIEINKIENKVTAVNMGVGEKAATLSFTKNLDSINHVVPESEANTNTIQIQVRPLPEILGTETPSLLKIDVEGFELMVLRGAKSVLSATSLQALIIELNGCASRYGIKDDEVDLLLREKGFFPVSYEPFSRRLSVLQKYNNEVNTIYIRDLEQVSQKLRSCKKFIVSGIAI